MKLPSRPTAYAQYILDLEEVGAGLGTGLFILAMAGNGFSSCPLAAILYLLPIEASASSISALAA